MKKITTLLAMLAVFIRMTGQVEIIAHRGYSWIAPENTIAASKLAWKSGADAVEVDVYLSGDNKIMCIHDSNTKRTTGQDHVIHETDSPVLRTLDAGSFKDTRYKGEKIPFLNEIIREVPKGRELVVEIKCKSEILPFIEEEIGKAGKNIRFVFIAFDFQTIKDTKKRFPEIKCYWLCSNKALLETTLPLVSPAGLDGVSLSYSLISDEVATRVKTLGLELYTWTVDDPAEALRLIRLGVKGITTNRPGWLKEQIL